MAGQLVIVHGGLAVRAVDHVQQQGVLHLKALKGFERFQTDAVGSVGVAVLVHHLLGIAVGRSDLLVGQLAAQLPEAGIHGGEGLQRFLRLVGHIIADHGGVAAVRIGGDGLFQEGFDIRGVLIGASKLGRLLISAELCQKVHAGSDSEVPDGTHGVRSGDGAACKAEHQCQCAYQREKFLFHVCCSLLFEISAIACRMLCSSSSGFSSGWRTTER